MSSPATDSTITAPPAPAAGEAELFCPDCGYDLRGLASGRCPECGLAVDPAALAVSRVPWTFRHDLGTWRAYWRTVWLVIRRPGRAGSEVVRPVAWDDALRFRLRTALVASAAPIVALIAASIAGVDWTALGGAFGERLPNQPPLPPRVRLAWALELAAAPIACAAVYLFFRAATGVAGFFFYPPHLTPARRARAAALGQYACAPLALTPLSLLAGGVAVWSYRSLGPLRDGPFILAGSIAAIVGAVVIAVQLWSTFHAPLRMLARATQCSPSRLIALAVTMPVAWVVLGAVIAIGIPAAYLFLCVVLLSFIG